MSHVPHNIYTYGTQRHRNIVMKNFLVFREDSGFVWAEACTV